MLDHKLYDNPTVVLATGEGRFAGETIAHNHMYYIYPVVSPVAKGRVLDIDFSPITERDDVVAYFTAADIPGKNAIGAIQRSEEPLMAEGSVEYIGQPVACVVAKTWEAARDAAHDVIVSCEALPALTTFDDAISAESFFGEHLVVACGDLKKGFVQSTHIVKGVFETCAQEHAYIETNRAYALPGEHGSGLKLYCATQGISDVQDVVSILLGVKNSDIEVDVLRVGGAFGGKERGGTMWSGFAALGCLLTGKPCGCILDREDDMAWTGKRHPFRFTYEVGCTDEGKITAFDVVMDANGGAYEDFTIAIMERAMLGIDGPYYLENAHILGRSCKTNLPANTAFRGFGAPQATVAMEVIMAEIAHTVRKPLLEVQQLNFYQEGQITPYGQPIYEVASPALLQRLDQRVDIASIRKKVDDFNKDHRFVKRGIGFVPVKYGIGFTATFLNQGNALIHVFSDGSISVSHGGIDMGQGLYRKVQKIVAETFGVSCDRIRCESTNTKRIGSVASTAASTGTDLNGYAARIAALEIQESMRKAAAEMLHEVHGLYPYPENIEFKDDLWWDNRLKHERHTFEELASYCYFHRYKMGAQGHYATPGLYYSMKDGKGTPFSYFTTGNCLVVSEVDMLTGMSRLVEVHICHEGGRIIDTPIDRGQIIGGFMQGYGYATMEELRSQADGKISANSFSTYKVPLCNDYPEILDIDLMESHNALSSVLGSKGVGEPPLLYGLAAFMAIRDAIESLNGHSAVCHLQHPATAERVLMEIERMKDEATGK
jgi:xanthine dehydrogenase large subunit